jgi:predicted enzyme related to lactoylglutathione lyase
MTTVEHYLPGTPAWVDMVAADRNAATAFYGGLLGWDFTLTDSDPAAYAIATIGGRSVAGISGPVPEQDTGPVAWTVYIATDDADATAARVRGAEGSVLLEPADIDDSGRMFIAADPAGGVFAGWQPRELIGAQVVDEPGALTWNELYSRNAAAARDFYANVFGYRYEQIGDGETFDYTTVIVGGRGVAGIMQMDATFPAELPSYWLTYFAVDDVDKTAAHAQELGGTLTRQPGDSPYGRLAGIQDPQGGRFMVITPVTDPRG